MNPKRHEWWSPQYRIKAGRESNTADIPEVATNECPVSLIDAETKAILEMVSRNRRTKEAAGATLFGPDTAGWPAWWVDAVNVVEVQRLLVESAMAEAVIPHGS